MHTLYLLLLLITTCFTASAQVTINVTNDYHEVTTVYTDSVYTGMSGTITFQNRINAYQPALLTRGLHFKNNAFTLLTNNITAQSLNGSPIIGAHGAGTVVKMTGDFKADVAQTVPSFLINNGGKIILGESMIIDLVQDGSYFTRQFWIWGDGTGTIEFEEGFIADRSAFGTSPNGLGSIRLSNTTLITNHTQNHPIGYRPGGTPLENGTGAINSHLVFENEGGSVWKVLTNDQNFRGGIWANVDVCIETVKNLEVSGVNSVWGDYTNFGGMQMLKPDLILCKKGAGELKLSGTQSYASGSTISVQEGTLNLNSNPTSGEKGKDNSNNNDLSVSVEGGATLKITADSAKIDSLVMKADNALLEVNIGSVFSGNHATADGVLKIAIPAGTSLTTGDEFTVFDFTSVSGAFDEVQLPDFGGEIVWNTSDLLTTGKISVVSGSITTGIAEAVSAYKLLPVPNPATDRIVLQGLPKTGKAEVSIYDVTGQVFSTITLTDTNSVSTEHIPAGMYFFHVQSADVNQTMKVIIEQR